MKRSEVWAATSVRSKITLSLGRNQAHDTEREQQISLQPDTWPITEEQLIDDFRGIYAGLVDKLLVSFNHD